jgi:hypothetical protein
MTTTYIQRINDKVESKIKSVQRRTANHTADQLRLKLSMAELNLENALDERDYLMETEWIPLITDFKAELLEAIRLSQRLDLLSSRRVEEILNGLLERLGQKEDGVGRSHNSFPL